MKSWIRILFGLACLLAAQPSPAQTERAWNVLLSPGQAGWESYFRQAAITGPQQATPPAFAQPLLWLAQLDRVESLVPSSQFSATEEAARWFTITFDASLSSDPAAALMASGAFEEVAPVHSLQLDAVAYLPNDDSLDRQWYHGFIRSQEAWNISRGSSQVRIGVIDTGIDYGHEEFEGQMWINTAEDLNGNGRLDPWPATENRAGVFGDFDGLDQDGNGFADDVIGYDFADQPDDPSFGDYFGPDPDPWDDNAHGTLVAGVIGAKMDNNYGGAGIAPDCRLVVLRAFTADGTGQDDDISRAIIYAADNGIQLLNFSFGDIYPSRMMQAAIRYAYVRGVVMVGSAGNGQGDDLHYPSGFSEVISVSGSTYDATTGREFFWPLSSFGITVDLCAPAAGILTTQPRDTLANGNIKAFTRTQGTSFSAPMVTAALGLVMSVKGPLLPEQARGLLRSSTDDLGSPGWDHFSGAGRLNMLRMLQAVGNSETSILAPAHDSGSPSDSVWIVGTVLHPEFSAWHLEYQPGTEGDDEWISILADQPYQAAADTLGLWVTAGLEEGEYTLRLRLDKTDGVTIEDRIRFVVDRSAPVIEVFEATSAWLDHRNGWFFRFRVSDQGRHSLFYRRLGDPVFRSETADRFTRNEDFFLPQDALPAGTYEWFIESENLAGLVSRTPSQTFTWNPRSIQRLGVNAAGNPIPMGRYLETLHDWDQDGQPEIAMSEYDASLSFGKMKWYEYNGAFFRAVDSLTFAPVLIPKGAADVNQDGRMELLVSVNDSMYVMSPAAAGEFPKETLWQEADQGRYAASFEDTDGDGEPELTARDSKDFFVYEWENGFSQVATLANTTSPTLAPGLARLWTADANQNGRPELLFGDADADLIVYEHQSGNSYELVLADDPNYGEANAETFITTGDFDGDGYREWFTAIHTSDLENADGEYETPFWRLRIYDKTPLADFAVVWEDFLFDNETKTYNAVSSGNLDLDPAEEILFSTFPRTYLLEFEAGEYAFTWFQTGNIQTHHVIGDFNGNGVNEFTLGRGDSAFFFEKNVFFNGPQPLTSLSGRVLGTDRVELNWIGVPNATRYVLFRVPNPDSNNVAQVTPNLTGNRFLDSTPLQAWEPQLYVMQSENPALPTPNSGFGNAIVLFPHERPRLDSAKALSATQVKAWFSQPMLDRDQDKAYFRVDDANYPMALLADGDPGNSLILNLGKPLDEGWHTLRIDTTLMDAFRGVLDPAFAAASFFYEQNEEELLILSRWEVVDDKTARLYFNFPLDEATALDSNHYELSPVGSIAGVSWGSDDEDAVDVHIADARLGALGYPLSVTVKEVCGIQGICIGETGNTATFSMHMQDLSEVFVYPNPVRNHVLFEGVRFANLTRQAVIEVMTVSGRRVKRLEEKDGDGGLEWDLRDEGGRRISPGVYIYHVYTEEEGVEAFVGKFSLVE